MVGPKPVRSMSSLKKMREIGTKTHTKERTHEDIRRWLSTCQGKKETILTNTMTSDFLPLKL